MKKIILLLVFATIIGSCNRSTEKVDVVKGSVPEAEAVQIARLEAELNCCQNENLELTLRLEECMDGYEMKKVAKTTSSTSSNIKKSAVIKRKAVATKSATVTPTPATGSVIKVTSATTNLDYLRQNGKILFCVRVNEQEDCYFPHYALLHDKGKGINYEVNNDGGVNFKVEPTNFYDGVDGLIDDGTFYVSEDLIKESLAAGRLQYLSIVEITASFTDWNLKPMTLENGFWIYRTQ